MYKNIYKTIYFLSILVCSQYAFGASEPGAGQPFFDIGIKTGRKKDSSVRSIPSVMLRAGSFKYELNLARLVKYVLVHEGYMHMADNYCSTHGEFWFPKVHYPHASNGRGFGEGYGVNRVVFANVATDILCDTLQVETLCADRHPVVQYAGRLAARTALYTAVRSAQKAYYHGDYTPRLHIPLFFFEA